MHSADFFRTTSPRRILEDYLDVNADVAGRDTLLQLAPFALYKKIGKHKIAGLFTINPRTARLHRCWFIWNTLRLAGLQEHWYAEELNRGDINWKKWVRRIGRRSTEEQREVWRKLLYVREFPEPNSKWPERYWTKGGSWCKTIGMTKILVMHEHLERPDCWYKKRIGEHGLRLIEDELMAICNPDKDIMPTQYHRAVNYVRARARDFTGMQMQMSWLPWFFQMDVVDEEDKWYQQNGRVARTHHRTIEW